jgi:hypothetical protein
MNQCPQCGQTTADADAVIAGQAGYSDTPGGHSDRHTLVIESAERIVSESGGSR